MPDITANFKTFINIVTSSDLLSGARWWTIQQTIMLNKVKTTVH